MSTEWPPLRGEQIVSKAREYIGTPWHHDARLKGVGIDCTGLLACVLVELGVDVKDRRGYTLGDEYEAMESAVAEHADKYFVSAKGCDVVLIPRDESGLLTIAASVQGRCIGHLYLQPGDVFLFRNTDLPPNLRMLNHCGIYNGEGGMIHAWNASAIGKVCEHPLDSFWLRSIAAVYRYKGLVIE